MIKTIKRLLEIKERQLEIEENMNKTLMWILLELRSRNVKGRNRKSNK